MRGLMPCILAGIAAVVAMDILAPPLGLGLATVAQSATDPNQQIVDRTRKGDRLQIPKANGRRISDAKARSARFLPARRRIFPAVVLLKGRVPGPRSVEVPS
jgi:hypothetical protein